MVLLRALIRQVLCVVVGRNFVKGSEGTLLLKPNDQQAADAGTERLQRHWCTCLLLHIIPQVPVVVMFSNGRYSSVSPTTIPTNVPQPTVVFNLSPTPPAPTFQAPTPTKAVSPPLAPTATKLALVQLSVSKVLKIFG